MQSQLLYIWFCTLWQRIIYLPYNLFLLFNVFNVLRIHDVLYGLGYLYLSNGSGSCHFCQRHSMRQQKTFFFKFSCLLFSKATLTSFFKDKRSQRSHKTVRTVILSLFAWWQKVPDTQGPKTDPAPQHCYLHLQRTLIKPTTISVKMIGKNE